ncbi:enoyl-CoA hydratase/isomerase family protein [Amycolatopsis sp. K13G38]|uniref:Enoyl-CoA hydratase/isomerase family protein n=1 Tax=Amycolatopsis acididurans TaxID=2724524 RepID=A0ABX1JG13_9PSEU|nr:enoyl-CoA hydratase/isomerase family protein [Amycolatopsis acididurans]NKQ58683.1 enoyl-CoA hydratase/isomerase family protein [Amycolatopsis acididurans]
MSAIRIDKAGEVAILRMTHGRANALDTGMCRELVERVDEAGFAGQRALVLTGQGGVFSAGVDLLRVREGGPAYVREFLPALSDAFLALFGFPGPVVAAVNGHAIAGGGVLAAACDRRIMNAAHGRIGWPELTVGVPFPLVAMEILRCAYGTNRLAELTELGQSYLGGEALTLGLVDELVAPEVVESRAVEIAAGLAAVPAKAYAHTKAQIHRPHDERIGEQRTADDAVVEELWAAPETLAAIDAYVRRTLDR